MNLKDYVDVSNQITRAEQKLGNSATLLIIAALSFITHSKFDSGGKELWWFGISASLLSVVSIAVIMFQISGFKALAARLEKDLEQENQENL